MTTSDALACGCPRDGRPEYSHLYCDRLSCGPHADNAHDCPGAPALERAEADRALAGTAVVLEAIDETLEAVQPAEEIRRPAPWVIGQTRVVGDLVLRYSERRTWQPIGPAQPGAAPPLVDAVLEERTWEPRQIGPLPPLPESAYPPDAKPLQPADDRSWWLRILRGRR